MQIEPRRMSSSADVRPGAPDPTLPARFPVVRLGGWWNAVSEGLEPESGALVRFVAPYLATAVRREEFERVLVVAAAAWVWSLGGARRRADLLRGLLAGNEFPAARAELVAFFERMEARHRRMFPALYASAARKGARA